MDEQLKEELQKIMDETKEKFVNVIAKHCVKQLISNFYCCEDMEYAMEELGAITWSIMPAIKGFEIKYCPFCKAKLLSRQDMDKFGRMYEVYSSL